MEIAGGFPVVILTDVGQADYDPVDGLIGQVFGVVEPLRNKDPHEAGADRLVFPRGHITV